MKDDGPVWAVCANKLRLFVAGRALNGEDGARVWLHIELGMKGNGKEQHEFYLNLKGNVANYDAEMQTSGELKGDKYKSPD